MYKQCINKFISSSKQQMCRNVEERINNAHNATCLI